MPSLLQPACLPMQVKAASAWAQHVTLLLTNPPPPIAAYALACRGSGADGQHSGAARAPGARDTHPANHPPRPCAPRRLACMLLFWLPAAAAAVGGDVHRLLQCEWRAVGEWCWFTGGARWCTLHADQRLKASQLPAVTAVHPSLISSSALPTSPRSRCPCTAITKAAGTPHAGATALKWLRTAFPMAGAAKRCCRTTR